MFSKGITAMRTILYAGFTIFDAVLYIVCLVFFAIYAGIFYHLLS